MLTGEKTPIEIDVSRPVHLARLGVIAASTSELQLIVPDDSLNNAYSVSRMWMLLTRDQTSPAPLCVRADHETQQRLVRYISWHEHPVHAFDDACASQVQ